MSSPKSFRFSIDRGGTFTDIYAEGAEFAGARPGPVCSRKNGFLALTDANLLLGRLQPDYHLIL